MATVRLEIDAADGWVEIADVGDADVLIENRSAYPIELHYADSAPAASATGHTLLPGALLPRLAQGKIYARTARSAFLIVST
jgi:hypothetical protein